MPMASIPILFLLAASAQAEPAAAPPRRQAAEPETGATFRAEPELALVPFQVIAKKDTHVEDLRADEIERSGLFAEPYSR